ncbi:uncharacterized protein [Amphiura filiformis]|uniref:uncharacterized protein n=1 Tax=Amphiura filiformis TaxID=82378 RepID=UPI003B21DA07
MAAPLGRRSCCLFTDVLAAYVLIACFLPSTSVSTCSDLYIEPYDILDLVKKQCVVVLFAPDDQPCDDVFLQLSNAFSSEHLVTFRRVEYVPNEFFWRPNEPLKWTSKPPAMDVGTSTIGVFEKKKIDRSCLSQVPSQQRSWRPNAAAYSGPLNAMPILDFINEKCGSYRNIHGELSNEGIHRESILANLFHVASISNFTMRSWVDVVKEKYDINCELQNCRERISDIKNDEQYGISGVCPADSNTQESSPKDSSKTTVDVASKGIPKCDRISVPTWNMFFSRYLKRSKPVVIEGAVNHWPAMHKWTTEYLRSKYGKKEVHIKLAPNGHFEGVEKASLWEDYDSFNIPQDVKVALRYPDLVVVRPATINLNFSEFLDTMTGNSTLHKEDANERVSAYLEYSSIPQYLPELESDIEEFPFIRNKLKRRHLNIWLSDGNTLGKLHFDPFDNLLCQIRGRKELILFEPHDNTKLYEAHIPEALLGFSTKTREFRRKTLMDSTSMVMAPVDIQDPDFKRFPKFAETRPLNCTINEGDMLFMPAFWWHEVQSHPNIEEHRNVAVNFWYEPFLTKEFPCPECRLDVNPYYRHLL